MTVPLVTVCVPSYNKQRFVEATLDSIRCQTFQDFELIIVDDASSDDSVRVIEAWIAKHQFPCKFFQHAANKGLCRTLNEVLDMARGRYFSALAADDVWRPSFLDRYVARMEQLPDTVALLYGDLEKIDEHDNMVSLEPDAFYRHYRRPPEGKVFSYLLRGTFIPAPTVMTRTACLRAVGGFDEALYHEDQDMWFRLARQYSVAFLPECLVKYRQTSGSMSKTRSGWLRISQSQNAIDQKLVNMDPALRRYAEDQLHSWDRVNALYADGDSRAPKYARRAFQRNPGFWVFVMLGCIHLRVPHRVFWMLDSMVFRINDALPRLRRQ